MTKKVCAKIKSGTPRYYIEGDTFEVIKERDGGFNCNFGGKVSETFCLWEACDHLQGGDWERIEVEEPEVMTKKVYAKIKSGTPRDYLEGDTFEVTWERDGMFRCDLSSDDLNVFCKWEDSMHLQGGSWERIEVEEPVVMMEVGKTYKTKVIGDEWKCLWILNGYAYCAREDGGTANAWDAHTGKSLSLHYTYDFDLTPDPVVTTHELFGFKFSSFGICKVKSDTHKITYDVVDGEIDTSSVKMYKL